MKLDTLVGIAKETAAFGVHPSGEYIYSFYTEQLQAFANLIAQHAKAEEREACVKAIEAQIGWDMDDPESTAIEAIQARGQ
jgi:pyruvate-formate lyase